MVQPYFNPVEFGEAESERLAGYRARLLANRRAVEMPDDDGPTPCGILVLAILSAASGSLATVLIMGLAGWVR